MWAACPRTLRRGRQHLRQAGWSGADRNRRLCFCFCCARKPSGAAMDSECTAIRATVYEVHHQKLRDRHTSASCSSLDTLSSDASPRSDIGVPHSLLFRYPGSKAGTHPHMPWHHSEWAAEHWRCCYIHVGGIRPVSLHEHRCPQAPCVTHMSASTCGATASRASSSSWQRAPRLPAHALASPLPLPMEHAA